MAFNKIEKKKNLFYKVDIEMLILVAATFEGKRKSLTLG